MDRPVARVYSLRMDDMLGAARGGSMSQTASVGIKAAGELDTSLNRDLFLRSLIRELAGTLQDVVGLKKHPDSSASSGKPSVTRSTVHTGRHTAAPPAIATRFPRF